MLVSPVAAAAAGDVAVGAGRLLLCGQDGEALLCPAGPFTRCEGVASESCSPLPFVKISPLFAFAIFGEVVLEAINYFNG